MVGKKKGWDDEGLESGGKQVTNERPGARGEQEAEAGEHGGENIDKNVLSVAELCLDPSKRAIQHPLRLIPNGYCQSLLCEKPF